MIIQLNDIDPFPAFVYGLALFHMNADLIGYISCLLLRLQSVFKYQGSLSWEYRPKGRKARL